MTAPRFSPGDKPIFKHTPRDPFDTTNKEFSGTHVVIKSYIGSTRYFVQFFDRTTGGVFEDELSPDEPDPRDSLIAEMREALRPFAKFAEVIEREHPGWYHETFGFGEPPLDRNMRDYMRARSILAKAEKHGAGE